MKTTPFQARQGDVFFELVDAPRELGTEVPPEGNAIVLALGESSGHRHQVTLAKRSRYGVGAKLFQRGAERFLQVSAGGAVVEVTSDRGAPLPVERHEPVKLPPGIHKVTIQREWTIDREVRRVID